jgi:hypothetical protein
MKYDNIDFNEKHWKGKSRTEFIAHERHHSLSEKQLNEVFDLINPKKSEPKEKPENQD